MEVEEYPWGLLVRKPCFPGSLLAVMMTIVGSVVGLFPVMFSSGTGSEVMRRIAAPMVGGMVSATVLTLIVFPAVYAVAKEISIRKSPRAQYPRN